MIRHSDRAALPPVNLPPGEHGPCSRIECGHYETGTHSRGFHPDERPSSCKVCGPEVCPSYKAPGTRPCERCGVPENVHATIAAADALLASHDGWICPSYVRPAPLYLRALTALLSGGRR